MIARKSKDNNADRDITQYLHQITKLEATPRVKNCVSKIVKNSFTWTATGAALSISKLVVASGANQLLGDRLCAILEKCLNNLQDFPLTVAIWSLFSSSCLLASMCLSKDHEDFKRVTRNKRFAITNFLIQFVQHHLKIS